MVFPKKAATATPKPADIDSDHAVYVSVEALLKLRYMANDLSLVVNKKSTALMDGDSHTVYRGRGMEFAEVRPYQAGDDIRNIDWRVTARTQTPHTKLFQEERERPVFILVDQRAPMFFGSASQFKSAYAAKLAALLAWTALRNNDRIGALIFSDTEQTDSRALRGKHAALSVIHHLHDFNCRLNSPLYPQRSQHLLNMLSDMRRVAKPGSSVFLISDFHDFDERCSEPLAVLARHSDVMALQIYDALEQQLPINRFLSITNGAEKLTIAGQSSTFTDAFSASFEDNRFALRKACNQAGINFASLATHQSLPSVLQDLFHSRAQSRRGR